MTSVAEPDPTALVAVRETLDTPAVVGVPVMVPFTLSMPRPDGSPEALKPVGEPEAVTGSEAATLRGSEAVRELVITGATTAETAALAAVARAADEVTMLVRAA